MGASGTIDLNFGAFPGGHDATVAVTGQSGITGSSLVEAWIQPMASSDHSADEHMVESIRVAARDLSAGVGFTVYGFENTFHEHTADVSDAHQLYGVFKVTWAWI
jgi:hypothetical protein